MKILYLTSGQNAPSSRFRIQQFVPFLQQRGHSCIVLPSHPAKYEQYNWLGWRLSQRLRKWLRHLNFLRLRFTHYDVVVLERELFDDKTISLEQKLRSLCSTLILDIDDAIFLRHPEKFQKLCQLPDLIIAGNEELHEKLSSFHQQIEVVPTCVDIDRYVPAKKTQNDSPLIIGWTGTSSNFPHLKMLESPLQDVSEKFPVELRIIAEHNLGVSDFNFGQTKVAFIPWSKSIEVTALQQCDVGIMPLQNGEWERYKCGFKLIQYMGVGLPVIASPVGVNQKIITQNENGFLAETSQQWVSALEQLAQSFELRQKIGAAARERIIESYSVQSQVDRLISIYERAIQLSQSPTNLEQN